MTERTTRNREEMTTTSGARGDREFAWKKDETGRRVATGYWVCQSRRWENVICLCCCFCSAVRRRRRRGVYPKAVSATLFDGRRQASQQNESRKFLSYFFLLTRRPAIQQTTRTEKIVATTWVRRRCLPVLTTTTECMHAMWYVVIFVFFFFCSINHIFFAPLIIFEHFFAYRSYLLLFSMNDSTVQYVSQRKTGLVCRFIDETQQPDRHGTVRFWNGMRNRDEAFGTNIGGKLRQPNNVVPKRPGCALDWRRRRQQFTTSSLGEKRGERTKEPRRTLLTASHYGRR